MTRPPSPARPPPAPCSPRKPCPSGPSRRCWRTARSSARTASSSRTPARSSATSSPGGPLLPQGELSAFYRSLGHPCTFAQGGFA
ncbi:hypothetical protein ACFQ60_43715 [Streptomyces zhihengii]